MEIIVKLRLYNRKFLKKYVNHRINQNKETADGILWNVDMVRLKAMVKIQGTNEMVVAHFPRNWKEVPYWLKPRNAVRIIWRGGNRGYIEIFGEGRAIPTPVEGPTQPDVSSTTNYWISGGQLLPTGNSNLSLVATGGLYSINGQTYTFAPTLLSGDLATMNDPAPMVMGSGEVMAMGVTEYVVVLDTAPPCYRYRYDAFVVGTDGEIDYLKGTESANEPVKPPLPTDHLLIGDYILVRPNVTTILQADIGAEWTAATIATIEITSMEWRNAWDPDDEIYKPYIIVDFEVNDQYDCKANVPMNSLACTCTSMDELIDLSLSSSGPWSSSLSFTLSKNTGKFYYKNVLMGEVEPGESTILPIVVMEIVHGLTVIQTVFVGEYIFESGYTFTQK